MSSDLNRLTVTCRLYRDPEVRVTPQGTVLAELGVVVNGRRKQGDTYEDDPCFLSATAWEATARSAERYLRKGDRVLLEGRLRQNRWQDEAGKPHSRLTMVVEKMLFLDTAWGRQQREAAGPAQERGKGKAGEQPAGDTSSHPDDSIANQAQPVPVPDVEDDLPF